MPDIIMYAIIVLATIFGTIFSIAAICVMVAECENWKERSLCFITTILIICAITGCWMWVTSGDCKYEGFEYIKIERKDNLKFYVYNGYIVNLDKTIDDKEFKIKMYKWSNQWVHGIYYMSKSSTYVRIVPIVEKDSVEITSKLTLDK